MKKRNLLVVLSALLLVGCSTVKARPDQVKNEKGLVTVKDNDGKEMDIYGNEFEDLYQGLVDAGTSNTNIVNEMTQVVARREIGVPAAKKTDVYKSFAEVGFISEERFEELVDEYMVDLVTSGTYSEDQLFHEEKFAREQREALYVVKDNQGSTTEENFNDPLLLIPGLKFKDIFGVNGDVAKGREKYQGYREKVVYPVIYKNLLTGKYLMHNKYKALGRAGARKVRAITIDNSSTEDKGSAIRTLNNFIGGYLYVTKNNIADSEVSKYYPCNKDTFDIDALARIWKGVYDENNLSTQDQNEINFINGTNATNEKLYTVNQETIVDELNEIATLDSNSKWTVKSNLNLDDAHITELLSKYTGNYSYPIDRGVTLAEREIQINDIVDDEDLYISKTGLTSLPSTLRNIIFATNMSDKIEKVATTNFLKTETGINQGNKDDYSTIAKCIEKAANFIHYDSDAKKYYVVVIDDYSYSTADTDLGNKYSDEKKDKALEVAILLGEDSTYQKEALIHYFKLENKKEADFYKVLYHDQDFYDYMKSTYPEIFED